MPIDIETESIWRMSITVKLLPVFLVLLLSWYIATLVLLGVEINNMGSYATDKQKRKYATAERYKGYANNAMTCVGVVFCLCLLADAVRLVIDIVPWFDRVFR